MSHMLPLWFFFTWGGLDNLSYLSGGPVNHKTTFHISWRTLTICAACGPKVPVYLEELSSQQDSPSPAYSQFFTFLQASSSALQQLDQHQIQPMSSRVPLTHSCLIQHISNFPGVVKLSKSPPTCKSQSPEIRVSPFKTTGQVLFL